MQLLEDGVPIYGVVRENKEKIAKVVKYSTSGSPQVLAEVMGFIEVMVH